MGNTSTNNDKTAADDAKVKLIIGEIGRDTQTGIIGRGYSFDNGRTFHVTDTIYGRLYTQNDADGLWNNGLHEKVKEKVNQEITNTVEPAIKQADSAVAYANDAIEKSRVNSQAIVEINSAVSDAVSDAAVARSDGLRAWDAAQSNVGLIDSNYASASAAISSARTEAIAAADEAKASASAAQADIVAVRSDVAAVQADVTATRSDVATAKSDIADTKTSLTSQAKSLSSYAAQASAAGKDITTLKSQAGQLEQDMADTKGDVSQLKVSASSASVALSDAAGNISSLQATANSYSAALSDTNSNVASVTATASELETKYADAAGDISKIKVDAKGMTQTISDAQGDIAKLKIRADGFDTQFASTNGDINKLQTDATGTKQTLTNAKSDIAVLQSRADGFDTKYANAAGDINTLKVDASGMQQTLTDAKGDISTLQATATSFKNTLTDAQGNISTLQSDVSGLKKTTSDHAGNIATLQSDAKTLTSQMSSAQGDISTLKQTASGFSSKVSGMETSLADANGKINDIQANGGGRNLAIGTAVKKCAIPNYGADGGQVSLDTWKSLRGQWVTISCDMSWTGFTRSTKANNRIGYEVGLHYSDGTQLYISNWYNPTDSEVNKNFRFSRSWNLPDKELKSIDEGWLYNQIIATTCVTSKLMIEKGTVAHDWSPAPEDTDAKITTNSAAIDQNKKAIALKADQTTVDKTNGDVQQLQAQLKVQSDQIASKVSSSDLDAKLNDLNTSDRNLARGTSDSWTDYVFVTDGGANRTISLSRVYIDDLKVGDVLTCGITIKNTGITAGTMRVQGSGNVTGWNDGSYYSPSYDIASIIPSGTTKELVYTLTLTANMIKNSFWDANIRTDNVPKGGTLSYKCFFVKKGNINTNWSPAPEDAQTYTQTQIKQASDSWNANLTSIKNGLTDKYTNLHATVDGIQTQVYNSDGTSKITQLSDLVQSKVSSGDFTSMTTQLKNLINQRVQVGDVISQINQEAGGNTLIQVSNGKGSLILDAGNTVITGKAWIPVASIADLTADQIQAGTLTGSTVHLDDGNGNTIDLGGLATAYVGFHSKATNGDQTYIDCNGIHNYGATYDTKISQGKITTNLLAVNGGGLIDFRSSGSGITIDSQNIKFYNSNAVNGGIEFSGGNPIATVRDGTIGNELRVRYDRSFALTPIKDESARICASSAAMQVGFIQSGKSTPDLNTTGLWVDNDRRHVNLGVWGADSTWARMEASTHNIHMQAGEAHAWLGNDNVFHIYKDNDGGSSTATKLQVDGWAWVKGWVEAAGHSQHSALSTKTDIQPVNDDKMLKMVNDTDLATFLYKTDAANGETHRHIGLIIDDVHDVAQYQTPQDFIAPNGVSRDDDNMIGALFGAVKALTKRIKTLESKVG